MKPIFKLPVGVRDWYVFQETNGNYCYVEKSGANSGYQERYLFGEHGIPDEVRGTQKEAEEYVGRLNSVREVHES